MNRCPNHATKTGVAASHGRASAPTVRTLIVSISQGFVNPCLRRARPALRPYPIPDPPLVRREQYFNTLGTSCQQKNQKNVHHAFCPCFRGYSAHELCRLNAADSPHSSPPRPLPREKRQRAAGPLPVQQANSEQECEAFLPVRHKPGEIARSARISHRLASGSSVKSVVADSGTGCGQRPHGVFAARLTRWR